jgi:MoaA/NifB/PqqE/SkfB family radical SAM enzyme
MLELKEIDTLTQSLTFLPQLTLSGGEPLLRDDISEIVTLFYKNSGTRFFSVPTNALSPDRIKNFIERFRVDCPDGFLNFCLPFHDTGEKHDTIMGVPGAFEKLHETYKVIEFYHHNHDNISCLLDYVMSRHNYRNYEEIFRYAESRFGSFPVGPSFCRGRPKDRESTDFPPESYHAAIQYLLSKQRRSNRFNPYTLMFETIGRQMSDTVMRVKDGSLKDLKCRAGKNMIVIYWNGDIVPCELIGMQGTFSGFPPPSDTCGNLRDYDCNLAELMQSPEATRLLDWIKTEQCVCTWECAIYNRIMHSPRELAILGLKMLGTFPAHFIR